MTYDKRRGYIPKPCQGYILDAGHREMVDFKDSSATYDRLLIFPTIAFVTFGETRLFRLRHKIRKAISQVEILSHHGSFLLISGTTNTFWEHEIPKTARNVLSRINLTFRVAKQY